MFEKMRFDFLTLRTILIDSQRDRDQNIPEQVNYSRSPSRIYASYHAMCWKFAFFYIHPLLFSFFNQYIDRIFITHKVTSYDGTQEQTMKLRFDDDICQRLTHDVLIDEQMAYERLLAHQQHVHEDLKKSKEERKRKYEESLEEALQYHAGNEEEGEEPYYGEEENPEESGEYADKK